MLKLSCLLNDTPAANDIKDSILMMVGERLAANKNVSFPVIYNEMQELKLEIDAESAGHLYNEVFENYSDNRLSNLDEIEEFSGRDVAAQQKAVVNAMLAVNNKVLEAELKKELKIIKTGFVPTEKKIPMMMAKVLEHTISLGSENVKTTAKKMEDILSKSAMSLLPPAAQKPKASLTDNLLAFFESHKEKITTLSGGVNTMQDLFNEFKKQTQHYLDNATKGMTDKDRNALIQRWEQHTDSIMKASYGVMLGKSNQNELVMEALQQLKINGIDIVDKNGDIMWKTLMDYDNPDTIADAVKDLFKKGFKDKQGNVQKFDSEESEMIGNYFQGLYNNKLESVKVQMMANARSKQLQAKNVISDAIKDMGFVNLARDGDGNLILSKADWKSALEYVQGRVGKTLGIDIAEQKLRQFMKHENYNDEQRQKEKGITNPEVLYTDDKINEVAKEFRRMIAAKLLPGTTTPNALERLAALEKWNKGKVFDVQRQNALNKIVGVGNLDQATINELKALAVAARDIININNVDGSTVKEVYRNRGQYAFQALAQIERRVKEVMREYKIRGQGDAGQQAIMRYIVDVMGAASSSLLLNPGNFGENILTGVSSNFGETILMLTTNAQLYGVGHANNVAWQSWVSHFFGGVGGATVSEQELSYDEQSGERLRMRKVGKTIHDAYLRGGVENGAAFAAGEIAKLPQYAANVLTRMTMNSFDSGLNGSMMRKKVVLSFYTALTESDIPPAKAREILNGVFDIPKTMVKEIDRQNKEIMGLLKKVGLKPTIFDANLNKLDMYLSLYEAAFEKAAKHHNLTISPRQIAEGTKALIESAAIQAKILGGKKPLPTGSAWGFLNTVIYGAATGILYPQRAAFQRQQQLEEQGRLGAAAWALLVGETYKNTVGRFAGGVANFLALATTASPLGFFTVGALAAQKRSLGPQAADVFAAEPEDIRDYATHANLYKSMMLRSVFGTVALSGFILYKMTQKKPDDEEEDDDWINNLMQTRSGRRMLQKFFPLQLGVAAAVMYDNKDPKLDSVMERLIDNLSGVMGKQYDSWGSMQRTLQRARSEDDYWKAIGQFFGTNLPTININQGEQLTKFWTTIKSAMDKEYISEVEKDEEIAKTVYKEIETWQDAFWVNGAREAMIRIIGPEKYNRYEEGGFKKKAQEYQSW